MFDMSFLILLGSDIWTWDSAKETGRKQARGFIIGCCGLLGELFLNVFDRKWKFKFIAKLEPILPMVGNISHFVANRPR
jgi:hypothetical protein